ncbi:MAG: recombinase RecA [Thermodesulfobacteriota bacterium]|nr:recombinase RecA [Thermodesulfobacteriota bacterium]
MEEDRKRALEDAIAKIERSYGKGSIMRMGSDAIERGIPVISTGSLLLDYDALSIGGIPRGRVTEIYGPESSGKTTLSLHCIASAQAKGGIAAFVDAEHALDIGYAKRLGVNIDDLLISQPDSGEQALEIAETLIRSNAVDIVVVDSVAALVPRAEIEGDMGDAHMGLQARLMSQALRKLSGAISKTSTTAVFVNQTRQKIGVFYGNPETTTGGNALKFYASVRMQIRRADVIKEGATIIGNRTKVKVVKNKLAPPFKEVEFDIMFGEGISKYGEVLDVGSKSDIGIIEKSGVWYSYKKQRLGQGRESAKTFLKEHADIFQEIYTAIEKRFTSKRDSQSKEGEK